MGGNKYVNTISKEGFGEVKIVRPPKSDVYLTISSWLKATYGMSYKSYRNKKYIRRSQLRKEYDKYINNRQLKYKEGFDELSIEQREDWIRFGRRPRISDE